MQGGEQMELWLRLAASGNSWSRVATVPRVGIFQTHLLPELENDTAYILQIRARIGNQFRSGWGIPDPNQWPAVSRLEFTTAATGDDPIEDAPVINSGVWVNTTLDNSTVTLGITPVTTGEDLVILRNGVEVGEISEPLTDPEEFIDVDPPIQVAFTYRCRHRRASGDGPLSNAFDVFTGPPPPTSVSVDGVRGCVYDISWVLPAGSDGVEIWDTRNGLQRMLTALEPATSDTIRHGNEISEPDLAFGDCVDPGQLVSIDILVRSFEILSGSRVYSEFVTIEDVFICDTCDQVQEEE